MLPKLCIIKSNELVFPNNRKRCRKKERHNENDESVSEKEKKKDKDKDKEKEKEGKKPKAEERLEGGEPDQKEEKEAAKRGAQREGSPPTRRSLLLLPRTLLTLSPSSRFRISIMHSSGSCSSILSLGSKGKRKGEGRGERND